MLTRTAAVATPTTRPCFRPLRVVAPARAAPARMARAVISQVTTLACKLEPGESWLSLAFITRSRTTPAHRVPATAAAVPTTTRVQTTGPANHCLRSRLIVLSRTRDAPGTTAG